MNALFQRWIARLRSIAISLGKSGAAFAKRLNEIFLGVVEWIVKQYQTVVAKLAKNPEDFSDHVKDPKPPGEGDTPQEITIPASDSTAAPPPVLDPFGPAAGRGVWIWRMVQAEDGQLQRIIEKAKLAGVDWVAIKAANGTSHWVQFNPEVIRKIQEVGIKVFGWIYAYGNNPQNEAEVAKGVLRLGCDGLIVDAEREYEGKHAAAERYLSLIRAAYPNTFIAYSSFPIISKHPDFPYAEFGKYSDAVLPQCYWKMMGYTPEKMIERLQQEWGRWAEKMKTAGQERSVIPILPVGQGFNVEAQEVEQFIEAARGYSGVNLWEWAQMSNDVWRVFHK